MTADLSFSRAGSLGCITLDRPKALHALTLPMVQAMYKQLQDWKGDAGIHAVCIKATPSAAFCAGGDVRWLYGATRDEQLAFFEQEYRLNHYIHHLGKPYIALMDGITMGGGVGISLHGSHPLASERFVFAMPETSIGFFPDIGAGYLLSRCPRQIGTYLGLTGDRITAADAQTIGLIKAQVPSSSMSALFETLTRLDLSQNAFKQVDLCIADFSKSVPNTPSSLPPEIASCFSNPSVETIQQALHNTNSDWSLSVARALDNKCPLSLKITLAQLQRVKGLSLSECLQMDYILAEHFMQGKDFYEGIRAALIDKDKQPHWQSASVAEVSETEVKAYFQPQGRSLDFI